MKDQSLEDLINAYRPRKENSREKPQSNHNEETQRPKVFEREEDETWLAGISSWLNPVVAEDMDLLDTAKSLLQLADDNQRSSKRSPKTTTNEDAYKQKEFYKRFVEKKLSDLISTREGIRNR